jgi:catechol 2,3-dioxygenase-like lactoylglutathione lyase family enzyme
MLDHVGFAVDDYARSKAFYETALAPLGLTLLMEPQGEAAGFGEDGKPFFWIEARGRTVQGRLHVPFAVDDRGIVDAFPCRGARGGWHGQRPARSPRGLPPELLRRLCAGSRWEQHRGRLSQADDIGTQPPCAR